MLSPAATVDSPRPSRPARAAHARPADPEATVATATASLPDEVLIGRYRDQGCREAFAELLRRYERELNRHLIRYLGDPMWAEDVLQNTFLAVHLKCGLYRDGLPVRPWLYTIATHQAIDALRRTGPGRPLSLDHAVDSGDDDGLGVAGLIESDADGPLDRLEDEERRAWIRASLDRLPELFREVVVLAYFRGLKYREIAEELDIPVGTVKSRLHLALAKLQESIRGSCLAEAG